MSNEVFQIMKKFDLDSVELQMVLQCAPVLTGLKIANLLNILKVHKAGMYAEFYTTKEYRCIRCLTMGLRCACCCIEMMNCGTI